jgi:hypothetical protein
VTGEALASGGPTSVSVRQKEWHTFAPAQDRKSFPPQRKFALSLDLFGLWELDLTAQFLWEKCCVPQSNDPATPASAVALDAADEPLAVAATQSTVAARYRLPPGLLKLSSTGGRWKIKMLE